MKNTILQISTLVMLFITIGCKKSHKKPKQTPLTENNDIIVGANQIENYLGLLKGKNIAIVANNTSVIFKNDQANPHQHLVDSLLSLGVNISRIFSPEHGFRGDSDAGEHLNDSIDAKSGLPIISLYGKNEDPNQKQIYNYRKPTPKHLHDVDAVVFDIQDVGVRFYTYISTLHNVMEACAENGISLIVLDRPNPNGYYIDGPVLEKQSKSYVGLGPIPIVYGMTIGEYAEMTNGEKWLENGVHCDLNVIPLKNYTHKSTYSLPIRPSPNLPNDKSINLYASLCMFEGTNVSCGRGTEMQFQIFGSPNLPKDEYSFSFTPNPNFGSKTPLYMNQECYGIDLSKAENLKSLNLNWLIDAYHASSHKKAFFKKAAFDKLAGTTKLKEQIEQGLNSDEIKATWQDDLSTFKKTRVKYLIYSD